MLPKRDTAVADSNRVDSTDAFISYRRTDLPSIEPLLEELRRQGATIWLDTADIEAGTKWWKEIETSIRSSSSVVCMLSTEFLDSDVCQRELTYAHESGKRIIPVVISEVSPDDARMPDYVSEINWIVEELGESPAERASRIIAVARTNPEWTREHSRLLNASYDWDANGKTRSRLLKSKDIAAAESTLAAPRSIGEVQPTELQRAYVAASRRSRTRLLTGGLAAAGLVTVVSLGLAAFALQQRSDAVEQRVVAEEQRGLAVVAQEQAEQETATATARLLSSSSQDPDTHYPVALSLAMRALQLDPESQQAEDSLRLLTLDYRSRLQYRTQDVKSGFSNGPALTPAGLVIVESADGLSLVNSDGEAEWTGPPAVAVSSDGRAAAVRLSEGRGAIVDLALQTIKVEFDLPSPIERAFLDGDGKSLVVCAQPDGGPERGSCELWTISISEPIELTTLRNAAAPVVFRDRAQGGFVTQFPPEAGTNGITVWHADGSVDEEFAADDSSLHEYTSAGFPILIDESGPVIYFSLPQSSDSCFGANPDVPSLECDVLAADLGSGEITNVINDSGENVRASAGSMMLNPVNGDLLYVDATGLTDGRLSSSNTEERVLASTIEISTSTVVSPGVAISPDGKYAAVAEVGGVVTVVDIPAGIVVESLAGHLNEVYAIEWSKDGRHLATRSDGQVDLWVLPTGRAEASLGYGYVVGGQASGGYAFISSLSADECELRVVNLNEPAVTAFCSDLGSALPGQRQLAAFDGGYGDPRTAIVDLDSGQTSVLPAYLNGTNLRAVSSDGRWAIASGETIEDPTVVLDVSEPILANAIRLYEPERRVLSFVDDGESAIGVLVMDAAGLEMLSTRDWSVAWSLDLPLEDEQVRRGIGIHNERKAIIPFGDRTSVIDLVTGNTEAEIPNSGGDSVSGVLSPDSSMIATRSGSATSVWRISDGKLVSTFPAYAVKGFTPDNKFLVSDDGPGSGFNTTLWSLEGYSPIRLQWPRTRQVYDNLYGPESAYVDPSTGSILVWDGDFSLRLIDGSPNYVELACAIGSRDLSASEWEAFGTTPPVAGLCDD